MTQVSQPEDHQWPAEEKKSTISHKVVLASRDREVVKSLCCEGEGDMEVGEPEQGRRLPAEVKSCDHRTIVMTGTDPNRCSCLMKGT